MTFSTQAKLFEAKRNFVGARRKLFASRWMTSNKEGSFSATFTCYTGDDNVQEFYKCTEMPNAMNTKNTKVLTDIGINEAYELPDESKANKERDIAKVNASKKLSDQEKANEIEMLEYAYKKPFLEDPLLKTIECLYQNNTCTVTFDHCDSLTGNSAKQLPLTLAQVDRFVRFMKADGARDDEKQKELFERIRENSFLKTVASRLEKDIDLGWELAVQKQDEWNVNRESVLSKCYLCAGQMDTKSGISAFLPPMFVFNNEISTGSNTEQMVIPLFQKVDSLDGVHLTFHSVPSKQMPLAHAIYVIGKGRDFEEMERIMDSIKANKKALKKLKKLMNSTSNVYYEVRAFPATSYGVHVLGTVPALDDGLPGDYDHEHFKDQVKLWGLGDSVNAFEEHWISLASVKEAPKAAKKARKAEKKAKKAPEVEKKVEKKAIEVVKKVEKKAIEVVKTIDKKAAKKAPEVEKAPKAKKVAPEAPQQETKKALKERMALARKEAAWNANLAIFIKKINPILVDGKIVSAVGANECEKMRKRAVKKLKAAFEQRDEDFKSNIGIRTRNARLVKEAGAGVEPQTIPGYEVVKTILAPRILVQEHFAQFHEDITFKKFLKEVGNEEEARILANAQFHQTKDELEQKTANFLAKQAKRAADAKARKCTPAVLQPVVVCKDDEEVVKSKSASKRSQKRVVDSDDDESVVEVPVSKSVSKRSQKRVVHSDDEDEPVVEEPKDTKKKSRKPSTKVQEEDVVMQEPKPMKKKPRKPSTKVQEDVAMQDASVDEESIARREAFEKYIAEKTAEFELNYRLSQTRAVTRGLLAEQVCAQTGTTAEGSEGQYADDLNSEQDLEGYDSDAASTSSKSSLNDEEDQEGHDDDAASTSSQTSFKSSAGPRQPSQDRREESWREVSPFRGHVVPLTHADFVVEGNGAAGNGGFDLPTPCDGFYGSPLPSPR